MGLVLASMIVSCSDEDNTIVPDTNPDPVIPTEGTFILPAPAVESNIPEHSFLMGALFSYQKNLRNGEDAASGGTSSTTFYNKPLFEVKSFGATETEWWDLRKEEIRLSHLPPASFRSLSPVSPEYLHTPAPDHQIGRAHV